MFPLPLQVARIIAEGGSPNNHAIISLMPLDNINYLLIDMDGVLYRGGEALPGLTGFFATLRAQNLGFRLVTNNSINTTQQYVEKMAGMGVEIASDDLVTSAYATAGWLKGQLPQGAPVYAVGEDGLQTALAETGFAVSVGADAPQSVDAVVAGLYFGIDYQTIHHAARLVRDGARFIGTNSDKTIPTPDGLGPGAGSILAAIEAASGMQPTTIGKPHAIMFEEALKDLGASPAEAAMVGDRLETDILGAQQVGLQTILVLSGVSSREDAENNSPKPTWIFEDIQELTKALNAAG